MAIQVDIRSLRNRTKVLRGSSLVLKDQKVPEEPCRKMSHLSRKNPAKRVFKNCVGGKFFENFPWLFPRSTRHVASIELSFVLYDTVVYSIVQYHPKKTLTSNSGKTYKFLFVEISIVFNRLSGGI